MTKEGRNEKTNVRNLTLPIECKKAPSFRAVMIHTHIYKGAMDDSQIHHITAGTVGLAFEEDLRPMLSMSAILDEFRIHRPLGRGSSISDTEENPILVLKIFRKTFATGNSETYL
ncbi:MAG: hypothetical protein R6U96_15370 [Promethearchaeia archaeon]